YITADSRMPAMAGFSAVEIWEEIQRRKNSTGDDSEKPEDLKWPEWEVMSQPQTAATTKDFKLREVEPPGGFESLFENTVLVERLREVRALTGFTRIESNGDFTETTQAAANRFTRLSRNSPTWLPVSEV